MSNPMKSPLSRRRFLKLAGTGSALAAVSAACAPAAAPAPTAVPAKPAAPAATSAPAVIAKPFAGKELTVFAGNHHDTNVRDLWIPLFQEKTGAKVTYTYALTSKASQAAKTTPAGFQLPAADVEFQRIQTVETRGNQARATYEVRLARPTGLFPAFQLIHPGAKIGQTKVRHAEFDKQGGKWGLLKTDEKLETKE